MGKQLIRKNIGATAGLLFKGRVAFSFDQLYFQQQNISLKKRFNFFLHGLHYMLPMKGKISIPPILQLEPANICNLKCLTCATGAGLVKRPRATMPFGMFKDIIDQVRNHVFLLVFWSWGEPFVNPDACRMIRYAKDRGLLVHTSTNGHFFDTKDKARMLVETGLDSLIVAVDGLDQQTYEKYRRGGNLQKVISSIENIVSERKLLGGQQPRITLRFIVMQHNEHQVDRVESFARGLGVDAVSFRSAIVRRSVLSYDKTLTPLGADFQRFSHKGENLYDNKLKRLNNQCQRPYANLTIFSSGDVVTCENDYNGVLPLGNVTDQSIQQILNAPASRNFFRVFRKNLDNFPFCQECENRQIECGETANVKTYMLNRS